MRLLRTSHEAEVISQGEKCCIEEKRTHEKSSTTGVKGYGPKFSEGYGNEEKGRGSRGAQRVMMISPPRVCAAELAHAVFSCSRPKCSSDRQTTRSLSVYMGKFRKGWWERRRMAVVLFIFLISLSIHPFSFSLFISLVFLHPFAPSALPNLYPPALCGGRTLGRFFSPCFIFMLHHRHHLSASNHHLSSIIYHHPLPFIYPQHHQFFLSAKISWSDVETDEDMKAENNLFVPGVGCTHKGGVGEKARGARAWERGEMNPRLDGSLGN